jgi:hypothetical protein
MRKNNTKINTKNKKGGNYPPGSPYTPVPLAYNPYNPKPQSAPTPTQNPSTTPLAYNPYPNYPPSAPSAPAAVVQQVHHQYQQKPNINLHYNIPAYQYLQQQQRPVSYYDYDNDRNLSTLFSELSTKPRTSRRTSRRSSRKTSRKTSKKMSRKTSRRVNKKASKKSKGRK